MDTDDNVIYFEDNVQKRILIDGDVLLHMACWQKPIKKDEIEAFRADIDEMIDFGTAQHKIDRMEKILYDQTQTFQPTLTLAQERFEHFMNHTLEHNYSEIFSIAIGNSKDNWRLDIHPEYKMQKSRVQSNKKRAPYIQDLRMWAVKEYNGHYCEGYEADDVIRIWANQLGIGNYVVCSVDKDLNLIPGDHFDPKTEDPEKMFWYMDPNDSAIFFWEQMLTGDSIDNIPGVKGVGPKTALKLLGPCKNEQEAKEVVVQEYDLRYGEEGYEHLMFNGQLLHIWNKMGDRWHFDPKEYETITGTIPAIGA